MKAKDLAAMLLQVDPESEVVFSMYSGCCGDREDLNLHEAEFLDVSFGGHRTEYLVQLSFHALPGYTSCVQVGGTLERHNEYLERIGKYKK